MVVLTALAVLAGGVPAGANSGEAGGEGDGEGLWQFASKGISADPPCGEFTKLDYTGQFVGTFTDTSSGATYQGPVEAVVKAKHVLWYENPFGIWSDSNCTVAHPGVDVALVAFKSVNAGSAVTDLDCVEGTSFTGTFQRVVDAASGVADIGRLTLSGANCSVTPALGGSEVSSNVTITITSKFAACIRDNPNGGFFPLVPPTHCATPDALTIGDSEPRQPLGLPDRGQPGTEHGSSTMLDIEYVGGRHYTAAGTASSQTGALSAVPGATVTRQLVSPSTAVSGEIGDFTCLIDTDNPEVEHLNILIDRQTHRVVEMEYLTFPYVVNEAVRRENKLKKWLVTCSTGGADAQDGWRLRHTGVSVALASKNREAVMIGREWGTGQTLGNVQASLTLQAAAGPVTVGGSLTQLATGENLGTFAHSGIRRGPLDMPSDRFRDHNANARWKTTNMLSAEHWSSEFQSQVLQAAWELPQAEEAFSVPTDAWLDIRCYGISCFGEPS